LAAQTLESEVAAALSLLLERSERWDETEVARLIQLPQPAVVPALAVSLVNLAQYDALLQEIDYVPA
jgi:hypothetical protein